MVGGLVLVNLRVLRSLFVSFMNNQVEGLLTAICPFVQLHYHYISKGLLKQEFTLEKKVAGRTFNRSSADENPQCSPTDNFTAVKKLSETPYMDHFLTCDE